MAAPINDIQVVEEEISKLVNSENLSQKDYIKISYFLGSVLADIFPTLNHEIYVRNWTVDDLYPDEIKRSKNKLTMIGKVSWLSGGGLCTNYQVDLTINQNPILYSYKFFNKSLHQILYIGKTHHGWIIN